MDRTLSFGQQLRKTVMASVFVAAVVGAGITGAAVASNSATARLEQESQAQVSGDLVDTGAFAEGEMGEEMLPQDEMLDGSDLGGYEDFDGSLQSSDQQMDESWDSYPESSSYGDSGESFETADPGDYPSGDGSDWDSGNNFDEQGAEPTDSTGPVDVAKDTDAGEPGESRQSPEEPSAVPIQNPSTSISPASTPDISQAPTLPARTIERRVALGARVELFSDSSLAAGWDDPDHTSDWLCLEILPERRDFWLDGADCTGAGLWTRIQVAGVYVVRVRVFEVNAESPTVAGPRSAEEIVLRIVAG